MNKATVIFLCTMLMSLFTTSIFAHSVSGPDLATAKAWCRDNPEHCREIVKEKVRWCRANGAECRAKAESWCENHPGRCKARAKRWCKSHPDACDWIKNNR